MLANASNCLSDFVPADTTTIVALVVVIVSGSILLEFAWKSYQLNHIGGPAPSSFLLGHASDIWGSMAKWKTTGLYPEPFLSWTKQYGGVVRLRKFLSHCVQVSDPAAVKHILVTNNANYPREPIRRDYFRDAMLGDGLLSAEGKQHDAYRKLLNPIFATLKIKSFVDIFTSETQRYSEKLLEPACEHDMPVNLSEFFPQLMLSISGLSIFGFDFDAAPTALEAYKESMVELNPLLAVGIFSIPGFLKLPFPSLIKRRAAQKTLKECLSKLIYDKLEALATKKPQDLLDLILESATPQEALTHTVTNVLVAHETTTSALCFLIGILPSYPQTIARMRSEYSQVIAKYGSLSSWEAVAELEYTQAVIHESLRLNSSVASTAHRKSTGDDIVPMSDGSTTFIPKGTVVQIFMAVMHRNPKYWANPETFVPDRFVEGTSAWNADVELRNGKSHAFHFMPFSAGAKNCIGQRFAMAELLVIVALLVSKYDFEPTPKMDLRHKYNGVVVKPVFAEMKVRRVSVEPL
ncbi:unnamed protein product [Aphanomyces euteiches]